jgi:hypothetical protein
MAEPGRRGLRVAGLAAAACGGVAAGFLAASLLGGGEPDRAPAGDGDAAGRDELVRRLDDLSRRVEELSRLLAAAGEHRTADAGSGGPASSTASRPPPIKPGVKFRDTFETGTDGWFVARFAPEIIGELARTDEEGRARVGRGALALSYDLRPGSVPLAVRMVPGRGDIDAFSVWIRTERRPAEVIVGVQERDDSSYQTMLHLEPADGWKHFEFDLAGFFLADDSEDENGRLDFHEIRSVSIADAAGFMGGKGENALLIDEAVGEYRRRPTEGRPAEDGQRAEEHF